MKCKRCGEKEAIFCFECVDKVAGLDVLKRRNERLEKALQKLLLSSDKAVRKIACEALEGSEVN